jgi:hypothetical protein
MGRPSYPFPSVTRTGRLVGRTFPWRKSVAQSKEYRESQPIPSLDVLFKLADKNGKTLPVVPAWTDIQTFAAGPLTEVAQGKLAVPEALSRIKLETDRLLTA